jgi:hypothetical protein
MADDGAWPMTATRIFWIFGAGKLMKVRRTAAIAEFYSDCVMTRSIDARTTFFCFVNTLDGAA